MTLKDWVEATSRRFDQESFVGALYGSATELWMGLLGQFGKHVWNYGENVFEREWDVLVVLDTCRYDVVSEVADEFEYISDYDPSGDVINSVASRSPEWIDKTFNDQPSEELSETAYITANPHSKDIEDPDRLLLLDEVWKYGWERDVWNARPETMTDRAISVIREHDPSRTIVHYMQPHQPYRMLIESNPEWFDAELSERPIWERLRKGEISKKQMWEGYVDNLRWVLDSLGVLLNNIDASKVAITADHGEAFGEWGCYGHKSHVPLKQLKRVPWIVTTASNIGSYTPDVKKSEDEVSAEQTKERLRGLGYIE